MREEEATVVEATTRDIAAVAVTRTATVEVATEVATVTVVDISHSQVSICVSHLSQRRDRLLHMETVLTDLQVWNQETLSQ